MHRRPFVLLLIAALFAATGCPQGEEEGLPPAITLPEGKIYSVECGGSLTITPVFGELTDASTINWLSNGRVVATGGSFTFTPEAPGVYYFTVEAVNEYGRAFAEIRIDVVDPTPPEPPEPLPPEPAEDSLRICFERSEYHVAQGRTIRLLPLDVDTTRSYSYIWRRDDAVVQQGSEPLYRFEAVSQGRFSVDFELALEGRTLYRDTLLVVVCPPEGTFRRPASASSQTSCVAVLDYTPAPGQFINENYTALSQEEACAYALGRMKEGKYVSLGGFGGSVTVKFDHSVESDGDYNFAVKNSVYSNWSEPGIVWVMQDEDGNGLPDDTWYELKGSEYGLEGTVSDYAVTYYRPQAPASPVAWTDNLGGSGTLDYLAAYHKQDFYYPLWVKEDAYTLRGTRLEARNYDQSGRGTYWINPDYGWGYADNYSLVDMLPERATGITAGCNHFRISDAVTFDGQPANLQYIDFVKVQTGLNTKSGWLGEVSTEVTDVIDFNLVK